MIELDDGSTVEGHAILTAVGRQLPLDDLGLEHYGLDASGRTPPFPRDGRLRVADGLYVVGDAAGPELHTHQAHYQGGMAVRMALGEDVAPDYRALPRATYTDPEAAFVGVTLEGAREAGTDAFELVADFATSTRGYGVEATLGHVTIVDRPRDPASSWALRSPARTRRPRIHECVIAIQARVPMDTLAAAIHAFPSTSRILDGLYADALRELGASGEHRQDTESGRVVNATRPGVASGFDLDGVDDRLELGLDLSGLVPGKLSAPDQQPRTPSTSRTQMRHRAFGPCA